MRRWFRNVLLPWIYVLAGQNILQLLAVIAVAFLLFAIPQADEALFAVSQAAIDVDTGASQGKLAAILPFVSMIVAGIALSCMVWYSARVIVNVDGKSLRPSAISRHTHEVSFHRASVEVPRMLGTLCSVLLVAAFIFALRPPDAGRWYVLALAICAPLPLAIGAYIAIHCGWTLLARSAVIGTGVLFSFLLLRAARPVDLTAACLAVVAPTLVMSFFVARRAILRWLHRKLTGGRPAVAAGPGRALRFRSSAWKLVFAAAACLVLLALLSGPAQYVRAVGSVAVVLLFLTGFLGLVSALFLGLRHLGSGVPGFISFCTIAAILVLLGLKATAGWSPLTERFGHEELKSDVQARGDAVAVCSREDQQLAKPLIVNAYGGGIRAAVFTAVVLAELDDRTQGAFGRCLHRMSGVSGGSLGMAVYLALREQYVAAGYWSDCKARAPKAGLRSWVENVLVRDHLSAVVGRLLTRDLIPLGAPQRGQALLDSWNSAIRTHMEDVAKSQAPCHPVGTAGLAVPLESLTGAIYPPPNVYFNSTNALTGERIWFSNSLQWRAQDVFKSIPAVDTLSVSLGEAVLHSARFPLVSPAGKFPVDTQTATFLVDGGYAENSGVETLFKENGSARYFIWLNIDGNPIEDKDKVVDSHTAASGYTALGALLSVRTAQASNAIERAIRGQEHFEDPDSQSRSKPYCPLSVTLDRSIEDRNECAARRRDPAVERVRTAPLGWFITQRTVRDMAEAINQAVERACARVRCEGFGAARS